MDLFDTFAQRVWRSRGKQHYHYLSNADCVGNRDGAATYAANSAFHADRHTH